MTTLLYLQGRYFHGAKRNIESAIEKLWGLFGHNLMQGEFSLRNGRYANFDSEDQEYLRKTREHLSNRG
jgi:hypothetical protein